MVSEDNKPPKTIALGISGSIAAYKSLYLARLLVEAGYTVHPLLTRSARQFVTPLSLSVLTGQRAVTNLWTASEEGADVSHVELAHAIDLLIVAPATADLMIRLARGEAADPVSSVALSTEATKLIAPAMEPAMWEASSTQEAIRVLEAGGWELISPNAGFLASGRSGVGRMAEPQELFDAITRCLSHKDLRGKRLIVTAGPTREHLDPARYISNPSSGKMGLAIAKRAAARGAEVTLIHGPLSAALPSGLHQCIPVTSTEELLTACKQALQASPDALIMAAAPADYKPAKRSDKKSKKTAEGSLSLQLEANPDILRATKEIRKSVVTIGFAAESHDLERYASQKLENKSLDMIVGNYIGKANTGFSSDTNEVWLYTQQGLMQHVPLASKEVIADAILNYLAEKLSSD